MDKKIFTYLLLAIFALAFLLRVVGLDRNPPELFGDELDVGYHAYSLFKTGRDYKGNLLPTYLQSFNEWRAPFLMYVTAPFVAIFGLNEWGVRLPSAVFGTLTVLLLYYLVYFLTKKEKLSLLVAFFLAISPWHIQYSRAAFEVALMLFLIIGGLFALFRLSKTKSPQWAILAGALFALSLYTYNTANVFVPLFITLTCLLYLPFSKQKKHIAIVGVVFLIMIIPLVNNIVFGHAADRYRQFSIFYNQEIVGKINLMRIYPNTNPLIEQVFHNRPIEWSKKIIQNYATAFSPQFLFIHGDVTFRHSLHEVGQLLWFQLPLLLIGLFFSIKKHQKEHLFWLGWLLIAPLPASITIDGAYHATRLFLMVVPLSVLSAYGALIVAEKLAGFKKKSILLFCLLTLFIFFIPLAEFLNYQHYYWQHYPFDSWRWWHCGYKEAIQSLVSLESEYEKVMIETTYEPALKRYLFWKKYPPQKVFYLDDQIKPNAVDGLSGFCLDEKTCFVDFGGVLEEKQVKNGILYLISHERNVLANWTNDPPGWIKVIKTIKNPWGDPLFYLVTAD
ncbi:hypothetical protein AMJ51_00760 [Microgenomates bacterium DG_75]|nr:MAG: hypothetical protein AMJ51_00760 [Microgenomates bacterium DG_75]